MGTMRLCSWRQVVSVALIALAFCIFLPYPSEQCIPNESAYAKSCGIYQTYDYIYAHLAPLHIEWIAVVTLLATVAIAGFNYSLAVSTKRLWIETRDTSRIASRAADVAEATLTVSNRPWILVTLSEKIGQDPVSTNLVDGKLQVTIHLSIKNVGQSPALHLAQMAQITPGFSAPLNFRQIIADHAVLVEQSVKLNMARTLFPNDSQAISIARGDMVAADKACHVICGVSYTSSFDKKRIYSTLIEFWVAADKTLPFPIETYTY